MPEGEGPFSLDFGVQLQRVHFQPQVGIAGHRLQPYSMLKSEGGKRWTELECTEGKRHGVDGRIAAQCPTAAYPGVAYNAPMDRVSWPGDEACGGLPSPLPPERGAGLLVTTEETSVARVGLIDMCSKPNSSARVARHTCVISRHRARRGGTDRRPDQLKHPRCRKVSKNNSWRTSADHASAS